MTHNFTEAAGIFQGSFQNVTVLNTGWFITAAIVLFTLVIITRQPGRWKELAFYVVMAWTIAGLPINKIFIAGLATIWIIDILSMQIITEGIRSTTEFVQKAISSGGHITSAAIEAGYKTKEIDAEAREINKKIKDSTKRTENRLLNKAKAAIGKSNRQREQLQTDLKAGVRGPKAQAAYEEMLKKIQKNKIKRMLEEESESLKEEIASKVWKQLK